MNASEESKVGDNPEDKLQLKRKEFSQIENEKKFKTYYIHNPNHRDYLAFLERFDIRNEFHQKIGSALFDVTYNNENELFTVHVHAEGYMKNGVYSTKSILSRVNSKFETIEEIRQTRIGKKIKNMFLIRYLDYYTCVITKGEVDGALEKRRVKLEHQVLLLGEGAIIILYRELAIRGGDVLETLSINNSGSLVSNIFQCGKEYETTVLDKFFIQVTSIRRKLYSLNDNKLLDQVETLMAREGFCVHHKWTKAKNVSMTLPKMWVPHSRLYSSTYTASDEKDFQLKTKAKDLDQEFKATYRSYLEDNPNILHLIGDYLQAILFKKPDGIYQFTKEFFHAYDWNSKNEKEDEVEDMMNFPFVP